MERVAVIDTGTNSTRLLIAESAPGGLRAIDRRTVITRLGQGVDSAKHLAPQAKERVYECVAGYAATIGELAAGRTVIMGTSSLRDAADGLVFLSGLASVFNFEYRLLDGNEEAALSFAGATIGMDGQTAAMVFDVGGGSTEVVIGKGEQVHFAASMKLGCVRLNEKFFHEDPPTQPEMVEASRYIDVILAEHLDRTALAPVRQALGVAGTVTTLAALDAGLELYDREQVHGHELSAVRVRSQLAMLACMTLAQRRKVPVMEEGRADVIVAGALIVERLLEYCGLESFTVSENDILDGAALAMLAGRF